MTERKIEIRKASELDLANVLDWLQAEWRPGGEGFYNNRSIIEEAQRSRRMTVLIASGEPVAFYTDGDYAPDIFEVRQDQRGCGFGQTLTKHMLNAWRRRASVLEIQCSPRHSFGFWERFGFQRYYSEDGGRYFDGDRFISVATRAFLVMERRHRLTNGPRFPFEIRYYAPRDWKPNTEPFRVYNGLAERLADGAFRLPERAICFTPEYADGRAVDCVVCIAVEGRKIFEDKVKREEAAALGVQYDGTFFIDRLEVPDSAALGTTSRS